MNKLTYKELVAKYTENFDIDVEYAKIDFAVQLAQMLDRKNISKSEFAKALGVSAPMVTKILRGDSNLTMESMVRSVRTVGGRLHLKLIEEESDGKWFNLVKSHNIYNKHENRNISKGNNLNAWTESANDHENEPIAA